MTRRRLLFAAGTLALVLAVLVAVVPAPAATRQAVASVSAATVVLGTAALLAILGVAGIVSTDWVARFRPLSGRDDADRGRFDVNAGPINVPSSARLDATEIADRLDGPSTSSDTTGSAGTDDADDEHAQDHDVRVAGESVDEALSRLSGPTRRESWSINDDRWEVRSRVRDVAETVLVEHDRLDPKTASARLDDGSWTDDPRAAAFLGDATPPPTVRVVDWLSGRPFERRARAAVSELAARADADTEVERP
ncbi:DUF7269 family protein [Halorientalis pallida]|uniref:DUF7269 family protein n=1 Tax=Halorientalis pallida TaxID=2479928 RepID=UPI003C7018BB